MRIFILTFVLFCVACTYGAPAAEDFVLPEGVKTCSQDDDNLNECIKEAIQDMIPKLHHGNEALGIQPLDPFLLDNNRFDYSNGAIQGSIALKGVKVYGASRSEIKDVNIDITDEGVSTEITVFMPRIFVEGNYKADVKLNEIALNPRGYFNVTITDILAVHKMKGTFKEVDGDKYVQLTSWDIVPTVGDMKFYASNLLPDPQLNNIVLDFVNQYWPEMYRIMVPETRSHWEPIILSSANKFLATVPFERLIAKSKN